MARAYNGGEMTPEFLGKLDDSKFQTGLALCRNFVVKPHGPIENRSGFELVREVKDSSKRTRLIPFRYNAEQTFAVEMGEGYFRWHTHGATLLNGAAPYEVAHPYPEADLFAVNRAQSHDVMTLVHANHPPAELSRLGAINWTYTPITFSNPMTPPASVTATATPAGSPPGTPTLQSYVVTSVSVDGKHESLPSQGSERYAIQAISKANPGIVQVSINTTPGGPSVGDTVYVSGVGGMDQLNGRELQVDSVSPMIDPNLGTEIAYFVTLSDGGVPVDTTGYDSYTWGGELAVLGGGANCSNNLFDIGAYNTVAWSPVPGASRYRVYKLTSGLFSFIGETEQTSLADDNIAGDLSRTPPIDDPLFQGPGDYPAAVGYFEQRRWFAGTINQPANAWGTRSGTETNFSYSIPLRADDAISFRVASQQRNAFRHIVSLANLMLLSDTAEWRLTPNGGEALSASDGVSPRPQTFIGTGAATPVLAGNNLVFAAARGGHLRELAYSWQANGYATGDLSLRAPHLFDGLEIIDMAFAQAPFPIVWAVSSNGKLLGLTYVPEHEVAGWHVHETDGHFESICVVPEGPTDVLYAIVRRRDVTGQTRRFVERMAPREDGFFVDCGLRYDGPPVSAVSGLGHLEGRTVSVLADGAVLSRRQVAGGAVTLDVPASKVIVGLPYDCDMQTLPPILELAAFGQGVNKKANAIWLRVFASRGLLAGPSFDDLAEEGWRSAEPFGTPPAPKSEQIKIVLPPGWDREGGVCVRQRDPLPLTILSHVIDYSTGS